MAGVGVTYPVRAPQVISLGPRSWAAAIRTPWICTCVSGATSYLHSCNVQLNVHKMTCFMLGTQSCIQFSGLEAQSVFLILNCTQTPTTSAEALGSQVSRPRESSHFPRHSGVSSFLRPSIHMVFLHVGNLTIHYLGNCLTCIFCINPSYLVLADDIADQAQVLLGPAGTAATLGVHMLRFL